MALLDREHELATAETAFAAASTSHGVVLVIDGPPGIGRTALLDALGETRPPGFLLLRADAAAAERDFAFGVVQQLFQPLITGATPAELERWMRGPGRLARRLLVDAPWSPGHVARQSVLHGLHTVLTNVSEDCPVLLAVDDLQWADGPSLRWLGYLARRLRNTRIALAATICEGRETAEPLLLGEFAALASRTLEPAPLSLNAVRMAVAEEFGGDSPAETVQACHTVTGGNPAALRAMLNGLRATGTRTARPADLQPLLREYRMNCLASAPAAVRTLADALAVLGDAAEPELLCGLSNMDYLEYKSALTALDRSGLLADSASPRLVHDTVRDGVLATMSAPVRERLHRTAAGLLRDAGQPAELVAEHLMLAGSGFDRADLAVLRTAAGAAQDRGATETAARYLRTALLDQPADSADRSRLLVALAAAELRTDPAAPARHVARALPFLTPGAERAVATLSIPPALAAATPALAATVREVQAELAEYDPAGRHRELATRLAARVRLLALHGEPAEEIGLGILHGPSNDLLATGAGRELLAVLSYAAALTGTRPAAEVAPLVDQLLALEPATPAHAHTALPVLVHTAVAADSVAELGRWLDLAQAEARRTGSMGERALIDAERAVLHAATGRLGLAQETAQAVLDAVSGPDWPEVGTLAVDALATVALRTQDVELALRLVASTSLSTHRRMVAVSGMLRGLTAAMAGDWATALDLFLDCGHRLTRNGWAGAAGPPWRAWAVAAHRTLGDLDAAAALAEEAERVATSWGSAAAVGRALLLRASLTDGTAGLAPLRQAVDVLRGSADQLELAAALTVLGRRLRAVGQSGAEPLAEGERLAAEYGTYWGAGSSPCAGPVPRLRRSDHVPLTRTEDAVVALVRRGWTNGRIADNLGVTRRAVEKTLTGVYRKLGVPGRAALLRTPEAGE